MATVVASDLPSGIIPEIIDGVLPKVGVVTAWAESYSGKSAVAWWMSLCISSGVAWAGHKTKKGRVLYYASEGAAGMGNRNTAALIDSARRVPAAKCASSACFGANCKCTELWHFDDSNLLFSDTKFSLYDPASVDAIIAYARKVEFLRLIVVDVLTGFTGGHSLEFPTPAAHMMGQAQRLATAAQCCVLLLHHATKKGDMFRGAQAIYDLSDGFIHMQKPDREAGQPGAIICQKMKDGPEFDTIHYSLKKVAWYAKPGDEKATSGIVACEDTEFFSDGTVPVARSAGPRQLPVPVTPSHAGIYPLRRGAWEAGRLGARGVSRAGRDAGRAILRGVLLPVLLIAGITAAAAHANSTVNQDTLGGAGRMQAVITQAATPGAGR
jgi:AAA domain